MVVSTIISTTILTMTTSKGSGEEDLVNSTGCESLMRHIDAKAVQVDPDICLFSIKAGYKEPTRLFNMNILNVLLLIC